MRRRRRARDASHATRKEITEDQLEPMACHALALGVSILESENLVVLIVIGFYNA